MDAIEHDDSELAGDDAGQGQVVQETYSRSCSPPGMINGKQARRMFGVSQWIWDKWVKQGSIRCGKAVGPSGRFKWYPIEELRQEIQALREPEPFPPPGMVDGPQARRMFSVSTWMWGQWSKQRKLRCGEWILLPGGGRTKLYPVDELRREIEALRNTGPFPPAGWVTGDEAARMFGVARLTWKSWVVQGKVPRGKWFLIPGGGRCYLWAVEDVKRMLEEMRGPDKAYWDPENPGFYRVPPGYVGRKEAWRMFGVDKGTWKRWEREGQITCGKRVNRGGPKLYKVEDLERLLEEFGRYVPPYPDPDRPGCYRVPLSGWDIRRREAIISAEDLPIVEGERWGWNAGAGRSRDDRGYVAHSKRGETTPLHRIIMGVTDPSLTVMHVNDDPLDCRRENLVLRTFSERSGAARKQRTYRGRQCTSRYKGVCWSEEKGKWVAQIKMEGRHRCLGYFDDEIAAAEAYDEAAIRAWGEHARLNFPNGIDAELARAAA
jgi:hypothetical protein